MKIGNWTSLFLNNTDTIYRMQVYKRLYTPYEMDKAFVDETQFEDDWRHVCICEAYELPDKDILLGVRRIYEDEDWHQFEDNWIIEYYKLSEIRLSMYPDDMAFIRAEWEEGEYNE